MTQIFNTWAKDGHKLGVFPLPVLEDRDPYGPPDAYADYNYPLMQMWLNQATNSVWILVEKGPKIGIWLLLIGGSGAILGLRGNAGINPVFPNFEGIIDIFGANGLSVSGDGVSTLTVGTSSGNTLVESLSGDSGTNPVFADGAGNINIFGDNTVGLTVAGDGVNTLTVTTSDGNSLLQSLTGDVGGAVFPSGTQNINIFGDTTQQFIEVTGTPASNVLEWKIIEPNGDGELLIGNTVANEPLVGNLISSDGSININYASPNIDLTGTGGSAGDSAFWAYLNPSMLNAVGNEATAVVIVFNNELYDVNNDYDTATGRFTAPFDGYYQFNATVSVIDLTDLMRSGFWQFALTGSLGGTLTSIRGNPWIMANEVVGGATERIWRTSASLGVLLEAGDTVRVTIKVEGAPANTATIWGEAYPGASMKNHFTGFLVRRT